MVDWHTDMLVTIRREPRQDDPVAACHDALFVVNRIAGVVHRLDRTPEETPRRTLWHFGDGHVVGGTTHKAKDGEGDIARAILLALPMPSPPTPATTTTTTTTSSSADEKPPKHFTAWAQCVENYNAKLCATNAANSPPTCWWGPRRCWHACTTSKLYTPLREMLSRRTFTPDKCMNPLAQLRAANAASGVQALRLDRGELVASSEPEWTPRSMMAIMDGADAAK